MDAAIAMYASLQSQLDVSKKELKDVEKLLVETEQRAAVNNNDVNVEGGRKKRRKVSPPPQDDDTNNNNSAGVTVKMEENNDHAYDDETDKEDDDEEEGKEEDDDGTIKPLATNNASSNNNNPAGSSNDNTNNTTGRTSNNHESSTTMAIGQTNTESDSGDVNQVIMEGCGVSNVNGTYTKIVGQMYDGAPVYSKMSYVIYRDSMSMGNNNWFIGYWDEKNVSSIDKRYKRYVSPNNADSKTPPTNGWVALLPDGNSSAPKLRLVTANNDANSGGVHEVSRSTGSSSTVGPSSAAQSSRDVQVMTSKDGSRARSIPDHIVVSECGNVELNGRYQRESEGSGMFREYNGAPVYTKKGEWNGKKVTFAIFRRVGTRYGGRWYIGRSNARCQGNFEEEKRTLFRCQTNILLPPKKGWIIIGTTRGGVNPAPKMSY